MSSNSFKYKARYGLDRTITKLDETTYTIEGPSLYGRMASFAKEEIETDPSLADKLSMFDFEGGPCLFVGEYFIELPEQMWANRKTLPVIDDITVETNINGDYKVTLKVISDHEFTRKSTTIRNNY
jgi:hypothetical protein